MIFVQVGLLFLFFIICIAQGQLRDVQVAHSGHTELL